MKKRYIELRKRLNSGEINSERFDYLIFVMIDEVEDACSICISISNLSDGWKPCGRHEEVYAHEID